MSFVVGDPVVPSTASFGEGFVVHRAGAPGGGREYVVRSRDGERSMRFRAHELGPGPPTPEFDVGAAVVLFGAPGRVLARSGDAYTVEVVRRRSSGVEFHHLYPAVPAHVMAIGWG